MGAPANDDRARGAAERSLDDALAIGPALLAAVSAGTAGEARIAASLIAGPAVVLGAAQRAGSVVDLGACASAGVRVVRRATTGTAVYIGQHGLLWALALPHVAALVPDATARTLLNRNVRGLLRGFREAGALAHYFGREWISVNKRPAAVIGFDVTEGGAVLIEVLAGVEESVALPDALAAPEERAVDRWLGKRPAALREVLGGDAPAIAATVAGAVGARVVEPPGGAASVATRAVECSDDPAPEGFERGPSARVPIGWIDTAFERGTGRVWIGGDVLAPRALLRAIAGGEESDGAASPIEGATLGDLVEAARLARAAAAR